MSAVRTGGRAAAGVIAVEFSDTEHEVIIYLAAVGLVLLGAVLVLTTVLWWRSSRTEHPALAPLEVMSDRAWHKASDAERRRRVEEVRPHGAEPLVVRIERDPAVDLAALERATPLAFDDLAEVALPSDRVPKPEPSPEPVVVEPEPVPVSVVVEPVVVEPEPVPVSVEPVSVVVEPVVVEERVEPEPVGPELQSGSPATVEEPPPSRDDTPGHVDPLLGSWTRD